MRSISTSANQAFFNKLISLKTFFACLLLISGIWVSYGQAPSTQATNIVFRPVSTTSSTNSSMTIGWTRGNGSKKLVVIYTQTAVFTPATSIDYSTFTNTNIDAGTDQKTAGSGAAFIVYSGAAQAPVAPAADIDSVTVSGLDENINYKVQVYEYNGSTFEYNTNTGTNNPYAVAFFVNTVTPPTWTPPVTSIFVEAWGGGGGGGNATGNVSAAGGGSGAAYTKTNLASVSTSTSYTITVGAGGASSGNGADSKFNNGATNIVTAKGGVQGADASGATSVSSGGTAVTTGNVATGAGATGTVNHYGGNAAAGTLTTTPAGGGGGESGGINTAGHAASAAVSTAAQAGAKGSAYGGDGADGPTTNTTGATGKFPGGGASGGYATGSTNENGGAGGQGLVLISYSPPNTPAFLSAKTTATNKIQVTFSTAITTLSNSSGSDFTGLTGLTVTGAAINGSNAAIIDLTVTGMTSGFSCTCLNIAANAVLNAGGGNVSFSSQTVSDGTPPTVSSIAPITTSLNNGKISRPGNITISSAPSAAVVGAGGADFTTDLAVGAIIYDANGALIGTVQSIADATHLTLTSTYGSNITNVSYLAGLFFTVTFSEPVATSSISTADFTFVNAGSTATAGSVVVTPVTATNSTKYTVTLTPTADGTLRLDKTSDTYTDANSNSSTTTFTSGTVANVDVTGPGVSSSTPIIVASTNGTLPALTTSGTITVTNSSATVTGSGTAFDTQLAVGTILKDAAGTTTYGTISAITSATSLTLAAPYGGTTASGVSYTAYGLFFTVTFSETTQVSSVDTNDFTVTGSSGGAGTKGTIAAVLPSGGLATKFTVMVTPTADGTIKLDVTNNGRLDALGNSSTTTFTGGTSATIDLTGPGVSSSTPIIVASTNGTLPALTTSGTITVTNSSATVTGSGTAFDTQLAVGTILKDAAGTTTYGTISAITSATSLTLAAPYGGTTASGVSYTAYGLFFTVTFSEATQVSSVDTNDFTVAGGSGGAGTKGTIAAVLPSGGLATKFTVMVTPTSDGTIKLDVSNDGRLDALGNSSTVTFTGGTAATIDLTGPDVNTITPIITSLTNGNIPRTGNISVTAGTTGVTGSGTAFNTELVVGSIIKDAAGTVIGTVAAIGGATSLTLAANAPSTISGQPYTMGLYFTVTFNESTQATSITNADFDFTGSTGTATIASILPSSGNSLTFVVNVTPTADGTLKLNKTADARLDALGNSSVTTFSFTGSAANVDVSGPSITNVTVPNSPMKIGPTYTATITVADDAGVSYVLKTSNIDGFSLSNLVRNNSTTYFADFTVANLGTDVPAGNDINLSVVLADPVGNLSNTYTTAISQNNDAIDAHYPTVTSITRNTPTTSPTNADIIKWDVTFSEDVSNIDAADFSIAGTTTTLSVSVGGSNNIWIVTADGTGGGNLNTLDGTVTLSFAGGQNITDIAGNPLNSTSVSGTNNNTFLIDNTQPSITNKTSSDTDGYIKSADASVTISADFADANGLSGSPKITIKNAANTTLVSAVNMTAGSGNTWNYSWDVSGTTATDDGAVTIQFDVTDAAGNTNTSTLLTQTLDNTPPTISLVLIPNVTMKIGDPVQATITVGDDAGQFYTLSSSNIDGYTLGSLTRTNNTTYKATFTVTTPGTDVLAGNDINLSVTLADPAGNQSTAYTTAISQGSDPIDATRPTVTSITRNTPTSSPTNADIVKWDVTFSENVSSIDAADFSIAGTTATLAVGGANNIWTVTASGGNLTNLNGTITLSFAGGQNITDVAGNLMTSTTVSGTNNPTFLMDNTLPSIINMASSDANGYIKKTDPNVTLSADVSDANGLSGSPKITIKNAANTTLVSAVNMTAGSGSSWNYSWDVSGTTAADDGIVSIQFSVTDAAGNTNSATLSTQHLDNTPPTLSGQPKLFFDVSGNGSSEEVLFEITEPINLSNAAAVTFFGTNGVRIYDGAGGDDTAIGAAVYNSTLTYQSVGYNNVVKITSNAGNSKWGLTAPISQLSYITGGNLFDLAGNEFSMSATNCVAGNVTPPAVNPNVMTLYPRAGNPEKIVFTVDVPLLTPTTANGVTGFSTSSGSVAIATYSESSPGVCPCTITLTSAANNNWVAGGATPTTVSYDQTTGNVVALNNVELATITGHSLVNEAIAPSITSVTAPNSTMIVGNTYTAKIIVADDDGDDPLLVSGTIDNFTFFNLRNNTTNPTTEKLVDFIIAEGGTDLAGGASIPVANLQLIDGQSNSSTVFTANTVNQANDKIDANSPTVVSINRQTTPINGWSSSFGTSASSVVFRITFSEDVNASSLTSADFSFITGGAYITGASVSNIAAVTTTKVFDVTVNSITGTGILQLDYKDSEVNVTGGSVQDLNGNSTITSSIQADGSHDGDQYYTIVLPEPVDEGANTITVTNVVASTTQNSLTINWNSTTATPLPTHYLVLIRKSSGAFSPLTPADGSVVGTSLVAQNITYTNPGPLSATFTGLTSGTSYDFIVYKYSLASNTSNDNIDYQLSHAGTLNGIQTNTALQSWVVQNSASAPTISSINDNIIGGKASVLQFTIYDDGIDPISPNIMNLNSNGNSPEIITFTLASPLTVAVGSNLSGFSASSGSIASAKYSAASTVTLTSSGNGQWDQNTLISYDPTIGNAVFSSSFGKMEPIKSHAVTPQVGEVLTFTTLSPGSYTIPYGVTGIQVEAWGAGGSGGEYNQDYGGGSGGGGGGAYASSLFSVNQGEQYTISVGSGGASIPVQPNCCLTFNGNTGGNTTVSFGSNSVFAGGGQGGFPSAYAAFYGTDYVHSFGYIGFGGTGSGNLASNKGGDGGNGGSYYFQDPSGGGSGFSFSPFYPFLNQMGGGGGSSAGPAQAGNNGISAPFTNQIPYNGSCLSCPTSTGGAAPAFGGAGGTGLINAAGVNGSFPGGGGGGGSGSFPSSKGADGQVKITITSTSPVSALKTDDSPFKFNKLVFTQNSSNNNAALNNWQNIIAGAVLDDGVNTPVAGTVNSSDITFNLAATTSTDYGFIPDADASRSSKTYTLKIWLKNNLSNALAATVDGMTIGIDFIPSSGLTYEDLTNSGEKSSRLYSTTLTESTGAAPIQVTPTQLVYHRPGVTNVATDVPSSVGVNILFGSLTPSALASGLLPEIYALDANMNLDKNYTYSAQISAGTYNHSTPSVSFINGKADLNLLKFTSGSTASVSDHITIHDTALSGVADAVSANIWPVISTKTNIGNATSTEPLKIRSVNTVYTGATGFQQNAVLSFDFDLTDDVGADPSGAFADNDGLPTTFNTLVISQGGGTTAQLQGQWDQIIAGAELRLTSSTGTNTLNQLVGTATIGTNKITFNGISTAANGPGEIQDGKANTYQLKIIFRNPILNGTNTLPDIIDNKGFEFVLTPANISTTGVGSTSSDISGTSPSSTSGAANNRIDVQPDQIDFITQWSANAQQYYDAPLTPTPSAKVRDANGNLDLNYNTAIVVSTTPSPAIYTVAATGTPATVSNGVITFDPTINIQSINGGGFHASETLVLTSGTLTSLSSGPGKTGNSFFLDYSSSSAIVHDHTTYPFSGGGHPTNMFYADPTNSYGDQGGANNTIDDNSEGEQIEQFVITDGPDADYTHTVVDNIDLTIVNAYAGGNAQIREIALFAGASSTPFVKSTAITQIGSTADATVSFTGLTGFVVTDADVPAGTGKLALTVRAIFNKTNIVDNTQITVNVNSIGTPTTSSTPNYNSSTFLGGTQGLPYTANLVTLTTGNPAVTGVQNLIEVVATKIDFIVNPPVPPASISTYSNITPSWLAQARDAAGFDNLDKDYTGAIGPITNSGTTGTGAGSELLMGLDNPPIPPNSPNPLTGNFVNGVFDFSAYSSPNTPLFLFYEDTNLEPSGTITFTLPVTTTNQLGAAITAGTTTAFKINGSYESTIKLTQAGQPIPYINYQVGSIDNAAITGGTAYIIDRLDLTDGFFFGVADTDGASTVLKDITLGITSPKTIRQIGLFTLSGGVYTQLTNGQQAGTAIAIDGNGYGAITFSNVNATALDNQTLPIYIAVTFDNTTANISDNLPVQLSIINATNSGGSKFRGVTGDPISTTGFIGGVATQQAGGQPNPAVIAGSIGFVNTINVVATSLDFTTLPGQYAGINEPVGTNPAQSGTLPADYYIYQNVNTNWSAIAGAPPSPAASFGGTKAGVVSARDKFQILDLNFNGYTPIINQTAGNGSVVNTTGQIFNSGILKLDGIKYPNTGDGTLRIQAGTLDSSLPPANTVGTITSSTSSNTITGSSTLFKTDLAAGSVINTAAGVYIGTVASTPSSNTTITLTGNAAIAYNGAYNTNSILSPLVNVMDVQASYPAGDLNVIQGLSPSTQNPQGSYSMKGGSQDQIIYGVSFAANGAANSEPNLKGFSIQFKNQSAAGGSVSPSFHQVSGGNIVDIFTGFELLQSSNNGVTVQLITPTSYSLVAWQSKASISAGDGAGSQDILTFTFNTPQSLSSNVTYYLRADVDPSANIATPGLQPTLYDGGYYDPTFTGPTTDFTNANIVTTQGTATGNVIGVTYTFASTKPPILITTDPKVLLAANPNVTPVTSSPFAGQMNVDPSLSQIKLQFDVAVVTLDGVAELYNRSTNTKVADLIAPLTTGNFLYDPSTQNLKTSVINPLVFDIQFLSGQSFKADEVYFVKVAQGNFDNNSNKGTGIADQGLNFYGGISSNAILYFKISSDKSPVLKSISKSFNTANLLGLTTNFDQFGKAYYLIVPSGSTPPVVNNLTNEIKNTYSGGTAVAQSNYAITQVNADQTETISIPGGFTSGTDYDIYLFAENDAKPIPVPSGMYSPGGATYPVGQPFTINPGYYSTATINTVTAFYAVNGSATLKITNPSSTTVPSYSPSYVICPNSFVDLTSPIVIGETSTTGFTSGSIQDFNIILPTGYEFSTTKTPTINLIGGDFYSLTYPASGPKFSYSYISNTVLNISYYNNSSLSGVPSLDYIVISDLRIKGASGSAPGQLLRFYGSNVFATPTANIAGISLYPTATYLFDNSYSLANGSISPFPTPFNSTSIVNYIPDNYKEIDNTIATGTVRLLPKITTDFFASTFSGNGVTNDVLTLGAVTRDAAFNISMSHTDPNGCVSTKTNQYLVYDHRSPVTPNLGTGNLNNSALDAGTAQDLDNPIFHTGSQTTIQTNLGLLANNSSSVTAPSIPSPTVTFKYNDKASYFLTGVTADLPMNEKYLNSLGMQSQIMSGSDWRKQLAKVPSNVNANTTAIGATNTAPYYDFQWDYKHVLNALAEAPSNIGNSGTITVNPFNGSSPTSFIDPATISTTNPIGNPFYRNFIGVTPRGSNYWTGGSLGNIEFTGVFRSAADLTVYVPFRQNVELFASPIPVVEIAGTQLQVQDASDNINNPWIFCENGGDININAFPAAAANSKGVFDIVDVTTGLPIAHDPAAFIDNGNGTATLKPFVLVTGANKGFTNSYVDFKVTYRFQENNSPAFGIGYIVIRITPNPTAMFSVLSNLPQRQGILQGRPISTTSYCENNLIDYVDQSTFPSTATNSANSNGYSPYLTINQIWDFGDLTSNIPLSSSLTHTYLAANSYDVTLSVQSQYGCSSLDAVNSTPTAPVVGSTKNTIPVGSIPKPGFDMTGMSVGNLFTAIDNSSVAAPSAKSLVAYDFDFDRVTKASMIRGTPLFASSTFNSGTYSAAGHYDVAQKVQTSLGCEVGTYRHIIILPTNAPTLSSPYDANFENSNFGWQTGRDSVNINGIKILGTNQYSNVFRSSWRWGAPSKAIINQAAVTKLVNGVATGPGKIWATGLIPSDTTKALERSFLYTPQFDLSSLLRPMITMNTAYKFDANDGAILQYSIDNKNVTDPTKVWTGIGQIGTGVNWYNLQGVASSPGDGKFPPSTTPEGLNDSKYFGWSGTSDNDNSGADGWQDSKHTLLNFLSQAPRVVFRIAFAANDRGRDEGMGIDNFRIGERNRAVLFENFSNLGNDTQAGLNGPSSDEKLQSDEFHQLFYKAGINIVRLNYHTSFPKTDPFNLDNPANPSGRALYYSITTTPYAKMDGLTQSSGYVKEWGSKAYSLRSLDLSPADIVATPGFTNGTYSVDVKITNTSPADLSKDLIVQVVFAEDTVLNSSLSSTKAAMIKTGETGFSYIVKDMLPTSAGTKLDNFGGNNLGDLKTISPVRTASFTYTPDAAKWYGGKLVAVIFLQDEATKEIHQAVMTTPLPGPAAGTVTGDLYNTFEPKDVAIYPNPADDQLNIVFPSRLDNDVQITMADQLGKITHNTVASKGEESKTLDTGGLTSGVYILQFNLGEGKIGRTKVIVNHKD